MFAIYEWTLYLSTSRVLNVETGLFLPVVGLVQKCRVTSINHRGLMYDTVQTAPDLVVKIQMSFQLAALDPNREVFFPFSNGSTTMSLGALLKNTTQRNNP